MPVKFTRTKENFVFGVFGNYGITLFARLRLNFNHLKEHTWT